MKNVSILLKNRPEFHRQRERYVQHDHCLAGSSSGSLPSVARWPQLVQNLNLQMWNTRLDSVTEA